MCSVLMCIHFILIIKYFNPKKHIRCGYLFLLNLNSHIMCYLKLLHMIRAYLKIWLLT